MLFRLLVLIFIALPSAWAITPNPMFVHQYGQQPFVVGHINGNHPGLTLLNQQLSKNKVPGAKTIVFTSLIDNKLPADHYQIQLNSQTVTVAASSRSGIFYGLMSLTQLLWQQQAIKPQLIIDEAKYSWRGSMIDVARHFRSMDYLKRHIQLMAIFKLNKLHLHLTDDQGWRLEIKQWPKLTEISGKTAVYGDPGGFYTQQQFKELIEYAKKYHVEIIPEIDMPGHMQAAIHAYPELACKGASTARYQKDGVPGSKLCIEKQFVRTFISQVIDETAQLFDSEYFHIGGDEVEVEGFNEFILNVEQQLFDHNKIMIGWEEIIGLPQRENSLIHIWRHPIHTQLEKSIELNLPIIASPCKYTYLDHGNYAKQPNTLTWCHKNGLTLEKVYSLPRENYPNAIGFEGELWGEMVRNDKRADNRLWPRLIAIAELNWSQELNYSSFKNNLVNIKPILDAYDVNYYDDGLLWQKKTSK